MSNLIRTVIYVNTLPSVALLMFLCLLSFNSVFDRRQTRLFCISSLISLAMLFVISVDYILSGMSLPGVYLLRRFTSFCNFVFSPIIPILLCQISKNQRFRRNFYIPMAINIVICSISIFTGLVFNISPDNSYSRGVLFFLPIGISLFYMVMLMFQPAGRYVISKQVERGYMIFTVLLLTLGIILEITWSFRFFTWTFVVPALILYYLLLNIQSAILDSLTGVYNRRMYDRQLSLIDGHIICEIALLDINNFKEVNDLHGHDAGDRYLISLTEILSRSFSSTATVFRIGGDEFVVISKKQGKQWFANAIENARQEAAAQSISFACGMLTYNPSQSIHQAIIEADRLMYQDKKQTASRQRG